MYHLETRQTRMKNNVGFFSKRVDLKDGRQWYLMGRPAQHGYLAKGGTLATSGTGKEESQKYH